MQTCTYCDEPVFFEEHVAPAMCEKHVDLAVLSEYLHDRDEAATVETLKVLHSQAIAQGGSLTICEDEIESLLSMMMQEVADVV